MLITTTLTSLIGPNKCSNPFNSLIQINKRRNSTTKMGLNLRAHYHHCSLFQVSALTLGSWGIPVHYSWSETSSSVHHFNLWFIHLFFNFSNHHKNIKKLLIIYIFSFPFASSFSSFYKNKLGQLIDWLGNYFDFFLLLFVISFFVIFNFNKFFIITSSNIID